ncbi:MAG: protein translocase subunit SecF [Actinobacteria bacterium]|nr:protein translocase subunit SecF [Actinomycetota bacterium]
MKSIFGQHYFQVIKYKYVWFGFSAVMIGLSILGLLVFGLNFGIDFTGGTSLDIQCKKGTSIKQVRGAMGDVGYGDAKIQSAPDNTFIIKTSKLDAEQKKEVTESLKKNGGMEELLGLDDIGPGWGAQVSRQAAIALAIFLVAILIYISVRFEFKMAVCAIIALFHDVLITVGVYAFLGREVTPATVIAVLTILGYSLYDTIVIFDRVKEDADQLTRQSKKTYAESVNDSINETLTRSLNTSITTLIPIVSILFFGGETLKAFAFALFIGVVAGTYSSIFLASPLLSIWKEREPKYQAYRERMQKQEARRARLASETAGGRPEPAAAAEKKVEKPHVAVKKAVPPASAEKKQGAPKPSAAGAGQKRAAAGKKTTAKARTKGPGGGKKKKKKKR